MENNGKQNISEDLDENQDNANEVEEHQENVDEPQKQKSLLETIKEIDEKERQAEILREQQLKVEYEKEREDYSKKIQQDKIELIKLKQGVIDHSDTIHEVHEEAPVLTFPQKVSNFFYHNMWWLWIVVFLAVVFGIIIYDTVTTPKPDAVVLMFTNNEDLYNNYQEMSDYFEQFVDDNNGDDVSTVSIYYIPLDTDENDKMFTSYMAKFSGEMQSANSMIVLADSSCDERLFPDDILYDLEKDFGEYENVEDYGYYLSGTNFAENINYDGTIPDDLYIGIRKVQKVFDSSEKMQKNFDIALEFMNRLIDYQENNKEVN
ncbi:MAG: hypothetical protein ACI4WH_02810 [Oscillospiraceae bacterium]